MKVSYKTDYAYKAVLDIVMFSEGGKVVKVADIARRQDIPIKYLEQILLILKKSNIVISKRGQHGGYLPARTPQMILLGEVVEAIEGDIRPITCYGENGDKCDCERVCPFQSVWQEVEQAERKILFSTSFADLTNRKKKMEEKAIVYHI